jgi:hypothetical protein
MNISRSIAITLLTGSLAIVGVASAQDYPQQNSPTPTSPGGPADSPRQDTYSTPYGTDTAPPTDNGKSAHEKAKPKKQHKSSHDSSAGSTTPPATSGLPGSDSSPMSN